jgi:hypothetical protein
MALTTYTKTAWANGTSPAINATNLGKIEDRLYDLTEEAITPTSLATTTATQEITSLPSTALKSRLDVTVKGNTYVNLVKNGNFADGTTNWSSFYSTLSATNNVLSIIGTGAGNPVYAYQSHNVHLIKQSDKIYIKSYARVTNTDANSIRMYIYDGTTSYYVTQLSPVQNLWYKLTGLVTITTATPTNFSNYFSHSYANAATSNGKVMEVKNVMTINLTNLFGAGNEPTLEEADLMFENWFDDVESTGKQIVKSVGKNLANPSEFEIGTLYSNGSEGLSDISIRTGFIRVNQNSSYVRPLNGITYVTNGLKCYDFNYNLLGIGTLGPLLTLEPATKYIRLTARRVDSAIITQEYFEEIKNQYQLEQGTTATTYEEYTETTAIIPAELKQVSDSIRDTFDANLGVHTKNISDWVELSGNAFTWLFSADNIGNKRIQTSEFLSNKGALNTSLFIKYNLEKLDYDPSGTIGNTFIDYANGRVALTILDTDSGWDETWVSGTSFTGMTWTNLIKAYMNGWKLTTVNTNVASCVWTGIASGTTQSGSGGYTHVTTTIDTGYTPYRMIYQLATPVITNYYPNIINAEPSGTVYVYPFVADYDFYDNGCGISDTTYPINSLEYVNIVDKDTGALSPVDLSTCTIATGGLSFTSTALSASDLVDFGYTYKELSTIPTIEYSYPTNLKATVDGNTNNIRDLDKKVEQSNTALTLKTDEIARDIKILKLMGGL